MGLTMDMKKLLMGSLALAAIGGASSVGLYYQSLTMERKEKKRKADEYYAEEFYHCFYAYFKHDSELENVKIRNQMREDGYTHAEIGIIEDLGFTKGFGQYNQEFDEEMAELERLEKLDEEAGK